MILVFNNDDLGLIQQAYEDGKISRRDEDLLGIPYCYLRGHDFNEMLRSEEHLYITAHGNNCYLGNEGNNNKQYNIKPQSLADILVNNILPQGGYSGNIYLSTCNSHPIYDSKFKQCLMQRISQYKGKIYGVEGTIDFPIKPAGYFDYKEAL